MIRVFIVDDEINAIKSLEYLIKEHCPKLQIIGQAESVQEAISAIEKLNPDLVFMDIEMPTGSGFEVVEKTQHLDYKLIFTTAYDQYAIKAFKVNAQDYLLKPIDAIELIKAVNKISTHATYPDTKIDKLSIPTNEGFQLIAFEKILRLVSESNYTHIFLVDGTKYLVAKTLKDFENSLGTGFLRVHNSHLINIQEVNKIIKADGGFIVMSDASMIPISKPNKQQVFDLFLK